jgi:hypothetical protein
MSWTTDRDKARWFAERWQLTVGCSAFVYATTPPMEAVLAVIDDRNEGEIVVDPSLLGAVRRVL